MQPPLREISAAVFAQKAQDVGSFIQIGAGNHDASLLQELVVGGLIGALTGSLLAGRIAQRPLRVGLLLALVILGCRLALYGSVPVPQG